METSWVVTSPTKDEHSRCFQKCGKDNGSMVKCMNLNAVGEVPCQTICHLSCLNTTIEMLRCINLFYCDDCTTDNATLKQKMDERMQIGRQDYEWKRQAGSGSSIPPNSAQYQEIAVKLREQLQSKLRIIGEQAQQNEELSAKIQQQQTTIDTQSADINQLKGSLAQRDGQYESLLKRISILEGAKQATTFTDNAFQRTSRDEDNIFAKLNETLQQAEAFDARASGSHQVRVSINPFSQRESAFNINHHANTPIWPDYVRQMNEAKRIDHNSLMFVRAGIAKPVQFSGDVAKWTTFLSEFIRTSERGHYREYEDMDRLRELIQGEARELFWTEIADPLATALPTLKRLNEFFGVKGNAVRVALDRITQLARVEKSNDKEKIKRLYTLIKQYALQCRTDQRESELWSQGTLFVLESKLSVEHSRNWRKWAQSNGRNEDVDGIIAFLEEHIRELNQRAIKSKPTITANVNATDVTGGQSSYARSSSNVADKEFNSSTSAQSSSGRGRGRDAKRRFSQCQCFLCKEKHPFYKCPTLISYDVKKRIETVNKLHICIRCLASDKHKVEECPNKLFKCYVTGCKAKNKHPLLHGHTSEEIPSFTATNCQVSLEHGPVSSHFAIVPGDAIAANGARIPITIMFDGGSGISLATRLLYEKAQYESQGDHELILRWATNVTHVESHATKFNLRFQPQGSRKTVTLKGVSAVSALDLPEQAQNPKSLKSVYPHLKDVPIPEYDLQRPQVLLGLTHSSYIANFMSIAGKNQGDPVAALTPLGWIVYGNCADTTRCHSIVKPVSLNYTQVDSPASEISNEELLKHIQHYNSVDSIGIAHQDASTMSADDQKAAEMIEESLKFIPEKRRYEIGLLWKNPQGEMPDNYEEAFHRLSLTEKRLVKLEMVDYVDKQFKEQIDNGWLVEISREEANQFPKRNYVYGFLTFNANRTPPKPRWVNDTAAKYKGASLNSMLLKGPDNLVPLPQSMCALREGRFAFQADVKSMFNQVMLKYDDQFSQLALWRSCNTSIEPKIYRQTRVIFGPTCSPSITSAVRIKHAQNCINEYPEAADVALHQMYVDDAPDSRDTIEEAGKVAKDLINMFKRIGWPLVEFQSNSQELLNLLPTQHVSKKMIAVGNDTEEFITKILGIFWKPKPDVYVYRLNNDDTVKKCLHESHVMTKREMLSTVMRIFDPLGQISPFRVRGLMIMQHVWRAGTDWRKRPPQEISDEFVNWLHEFENVARLEIPRAYSPVSLRESTLSLHCFVDAGAEAYAACVYLRIEHGDQIYVRLVAAKARVAPLKYMSIPRLELMSALIGARLLKAVKEWHRRLDIVDYVCWTDSDVSFKWIRSHHLPRTPFSAPRIAEIQELTSADKWRYVPSKQNVADYATKERQMDYSDANHEWFVGPKFLYGSPEEWPKQPKSDTEVALMLVKLSDSTEPYVAGILSQIQAKYRAEWLSFIGVVAQGLRFVDYMLPDIPHHRRKGPFTPQEFERAENYIFRSVQKAVFPEEYKLLLGGRQVKSHSPLASLSPYMCRKTHLIRATTRLSKSFPLNMRRPPILPNFHEVTDTLVRYHHAMSLHVGDNAIMASLRSFVWIINVKRAVRRCRARCLECIEKKAKPHIPEVADLPDIRFDICHHPFYHTGCDLFGPFDAYIGKSRHSRSVWTIIFTCMVTRAVYLELLEEQSTEHFLIALNKLWARRGPIKHIYSDNGRNFTGAAVVIKNDLFQKALLEKKIEWHFTPAYTPQFGGVWERLIKDIKRGLSASIGKFTVPRASLEGALVKIEANVNNRPLTELPISPNDDTPLTPYLLMTGHPNYPVTEEESTRLSSEPDEIMKLKTAQRINALVQAFRKRFVEEYAPVIARRTTTREKAKHLLKKGDYVIYMDPTKNPSQWARGVIDRIYPGKDKKVRVADVKLKNGEIISRRSVYRLAKLDIRLESADAETNKYDRAYRVMVAQLENRIACQRTAAETDQLREKLFTQKLNPEKMSLHVNFKIFDDSCRVVRVEMDSDTRKQPKVEELREFIDTTGEKSIYAKNIPPKIGVSELHSIMAEFGEVKTIVCSQWTGIKPYNCMISYAEQAAARYALMSSESQVITVGNTTFRTNFEALKKPFAPRKSIKKPLMGFIWVRDEHEVVHKILLITRSETDPATGMTSMPAFGNEAGFANYCPHTHRYDFTTREVSLEDGARAVRELPFVLKTSFAADSVATSSPQIRSEIHVSRVVKATDTSLQVTVEEDPFEEASQPNIRSKVDARSIIEDRKQLRKIRAVLQKNKRRPRGSVARIRGDHVVA